MKFLWVFVWKRAKYALLLAFCASVLSGAARAGLLAMVNAGFTGGALDLRIYLLLCVAAPLFSVSAELLNNRTVNESVQHLLLDTVRQILRVALPRAEQIGPHRILTVLTQDLTIVTNGLQLIPGLALQASMVLGCLAYLAWLSPPVFAAALGLVALAATAFRIAYLLARRHLVFARQSAEEIFRQIDTLTRALKEFKLSRRRRRAFLDRDLTTAAVSYKRHSRVGVAIYSVSGNWSQFVFFAVMGVLMFVPAWTQGDRRLLSGYGLTLLFLLAPLTSMLSAAANMGGILAAAGRFRQLIASLEPLERPDSESAPVSPNWQSIRLSGVTHSYAGYDGKTSFTLGPIDLEIERGEIVFFVGGNGCGKTTLAKLLCGLYAAQSGDVRLGGQPIGAREVGEYRELFGSIFADHFLFDRIEEASEGRHRALIDTYLREFDLADKVTASDGVYSTLNLSQGQRKRLALLAICVEDRPILVFDEWAADQDPVFKRLFYLTILPSLKASGKTIVVVTHDDAYFDVADRLVKLEFGQVIHQGHSLSSPVAVS